jgi:hypothetical protein
VDGVFSELLSRPNSLLTGNFAKFAPESPREPHRIALHLDGFWPRNTV